MKICAAVARQIGAPLSLETLELEAPRPDFLYNVGSGKNYTYGQALSTAFKILRQHGKPVPRVLQTGKPETFTAGCCDNSKIRRKLGWQPQFALEESLSWCLRQKGLIL